VCVCVCVCVVTGEDTNCGYTDGTIECVKIIFM
jgi:hypothetical protein